MSNEFIVRHRTYHKQKLWWIGRVSIVNNKRCFVPYTDIHSPMGYGYKDKEIAMRTAKKLQGGNKETMKRTVSHKEIQCLLATMAEYLAKSVMAKRGNEDAAFLVQSNAAEYFYANYVLGTKALLDEKPQERAETLYTWYLDDKGHIAMYESNIASNEPWDQNKDTYRGYIEAIKVFIDEVATLLNIEDNNETTKTTP